MQLSEGGALRVPISQFVLVLEFFTVQRVSLNSQSSTFNFPSILMQTGSMFRGMAV
jgi:hypothetical protein